MDNPIFFTIFSCIFFMGLVAWISWRKTRGNVDNKDGYFLAGRGLTSVFIAGSLLLTNLSAEQLIGLNGSAYGHNLSSMGWEVTAAIATIAMAFLFLPRYLAGAFTTLPQFLNDRFDSDVRRLSVLLFMLGYGLITIPSILYSGSVAVLELFDVQSITGLDYFPALFVTVIAIGTIGSLYAIFGGLKAVAISDTINGVGLLIIGTLVPILGLIALGDGDLGTGFNKLISEHPEKLNAIGSDTDPTPFGTLFTGMIFANLFYWCTNQYVIQRTLGAKSLAEGQKGVLFSGFFKILVPFLMMIPGVIAFHLYGPGLGTIDQAYPRLIRDVMPLYLSGFFLAVLLGAVFSSFNSLLNSAATLFALDIYAPYKGQKLDDAKLIKTAKIASLIIALFSFIVAPLLYFAEDGLWQVIRVFTGFYNIPTVVIVIIGLFTTRVPALAAKTVIIFHVTAYALLRFVFDDVITLHFLHQYAILFGIEIAIMLAIGSWKPRPQAWTFTQKNPVDMTPWKFAKPLALTLFSCVIATYLLFSPLGIASQESISAIFIGLIIALVGANIAYWFFSHLRNQ